MTTPRETVSLHPGDPYCSPRRSRGEHWLSRENKIHRFPWEQSLNVLLYHQLKSRTKWKSYLLETSWHTNLTQFQSANPQHMQVECSYVSIFPSVSVNLFALGKQKRELVSFDPCHLTYFCWEVHDCITNSLNDTLNNHYLPVEKYNNEKTK